MPSLPYLYGLPKIHKLNNPLRPIVCTASSVTYKLSKFLASILKQLYGKISSSYVLNTEDFVSKIRNIDLNGKVMVSFDVKSLFTNVPINDTLNFLEEYLETNPIDMPFSLNVLIKLIRLCVDNCFFSCNNNFYRQIKGLPMGSCISPILSNLYMEFFETKLLPNIINNFSLTWYRYVDDVFAVLPDNIDLDAFLNSLNGLSSSIQFTIEKENNNCLPFLDVLVMRNQNNRPGFKIYRKPTHSNLYIHAFSGHSDKIKEGAINNIFQRAYKVCDPEHLDEEIQFICKTFKDLAYNNQFVDKAHFKARRLFYRTSLREKKVYDKVLVLPSECENNNLRSLIPSNVRLVYSSNNTTKKFLRNTVTKGIPKDAGIYKIPCSSCDLQYIGESNDIKRRISQHKTDLRTSNLNSSLVKHRNETDHVISPSNSSTVCHISNSNQRKLIESYLINKISNFNMYKTSIPIDEFTSEFLCNYVPSLRKFVNKCLDTGQTNVT